MSNAFAPIVRARPDPIFGRPVHQGCAPIDYSPILLLKPFGFRIAPDTLPSGIRRATGSRSVLAVSGLRLRARLDFSIPSCSPGQRGITPAFGYSAPHPSAEGTSTPMIHALPSAHYGLIRLLIHVHARRAACRLPEPARHTSPGMDETSQVPRKELLHVHKVSDCARFFSCELFAMRRCCLLFTRTRSAPRNSTRFAAQYLARGLPCERFTSALAGRRASLGVGAVS